MQKAKSQNKETNAKPRKKTVLGRGLDALFPEIEQVDNHDSDFLICNIDAIRPNRYQPRLSFSEEELDDLSNSIKEQGIIQPLVVKKNGMEFELIAGERRLRAAKKAGFTQVPVVIKDISEEKLLELSIVENIQRSNLNPMEEAKAYQRLMDEFHLTQDAVAGRVGKSRSAVANFLRLNQLPVQIKESITENRISMGHARALLGAENAAQQIAAWKIVLSKGLSVRQTEALIKSLKIRQEKQPEETPSSEEIYFTNIGDELGRKFGTKVNIKRNGQKGKVEIEFYSDDDLDRLLELFRV